VAQIGSHLRESVDAQMRSERMKLDLITNVSHDLKTPLTSIIGYLDLLEKQELSPETRDYVLILRQKSERLATTVADLFTLAKATSGSETLRIEPLDLVMAARQTLGDLSDTIHTAGIPVKATMPESAIVRADSAKLYRVLQNILDNALRYSLVGTRIYLEVSPGDIATRLTLTNTASYEMTFAPEEILQRFVRGDASRTTEGSGLGLSIAQTFMQNFGGDLAVEVRGDAFVVTLVFPNGSTEKTGENGKKTVVYSGDRSEESPLEWEEDLSAPEEGHAAQGETMPEAESVPEDGAAGEGDAGTKETPAEEIIPGEEDVTEEGEPTAEPETQKEEKAEDNSFDPE
jgi:signal transduction histidine kinase